MATDANILSAFVERARSLCTRRQNAQYSNTCFECDLPNYNSTRYTALWVCGYCTQLLSDYTHEIVRMKEEFWREYAPEILAKAMSVHACMQLAPTNGSTSMHNICANMRRLSMKSVSVVESVEEPIDIHTHRIIADEPMDSHSEWSVEQSIDRSIEHGDYGSFQWA